MITHHDKYRQQQQYYCKFYFFPQIKIPPAIHIFYYMTARDILSVILFD